VSFATGYSMFIRDPLENPPQLISVVIPLDAIKATRPAIRRRYSGVGSALHREQANAPRGVVPSLKVIDQAI
jgi:hypothetical protein